MKGKIFNTNEVHAIIAGNKTMFREVIKPCKQHPKSLCKKTRRAHYSIDFTENGLFWQPYGGSELQPFPYCDGKLSASNSLDDYCPYKVGQEIFVKEKWGIGSRPDQFGGYKGFEYKADCFGDNENLPCYEIDYDKLPKNIEIDNWIGNWEQARLMPQWASRLTLEITDVKIERLQDISEEDCKKEGIGYTGGWNGEDYDNGEFFFGKLEETKDGMNWENEMFEYPDLAFAELWNTTHKKPEEKFEANPFVWVVDFKINK